MANTSLVLGCCGACCMALLHSLLACLLLPPQPLCPRPLGCPSLGLAQDLLRRGAGHDLAGDAIDDPVGDLAHALAVDLPEAHRLGKAHDDLAPAPVVGHPGGVEAPAQRLG